MKGLTKSLRGRLAAYFALSIVISLLISGVLAGALVQRYLRQRTLSDLRFQSEALASQIESEGLPQRRYITDLERMYQTRALIIPYGSDQSLGRLPQSAPGTDQAAPSSPITPSLDWDLLKNGGTQVQETDITGLEHNLVVVAHGFNAGGDFAGAVVLAKPLRTFQSWRPLALEIVIAGIASLAVSLLLAFLLARRLSRPLHEITQAATAVAEGDYSTELAVRSNDEIGRLADAFRNMTAEVRQAQEQQRQFVMNVSHELKTPLTAISGHAQALSEGVAEDPAAVAKSLGVIVSETRRLSRLIEDLISVAKFDARQFELKRTTVSIADVFGAVVDGLSRDAGERGVELDSQGTVETPGLTLATDPDRLRQILSNLTLNSLSHTTAGGKVTISSRRLPAASGEPERIAIEVSDTGVGIEFADLPHVFDRFYRAGNGVKGAGLGLGLAISRELARALGGDITVASTPGKGSRFTLTLPLSD
ncbi:MAG: ATP-binding protein [Actinobacteria bacterium]|nr:ATP-binding protein [Actinomycetota bacterium]